MIIHYRNRDRNSEGLSEYLGFVYEEVIRENCFVYALEGKLPFMPAVVGKWWGKAMIEGTWQETEVDLVAYDDHNIVVSECKYRNKAVGRKELDALKAKTASIPVKNRRVYYMLASKSGFTEDLAGTEEAILVEEI